MRAERTRAWVVGAIAIVGSIIIFLVPFAFIVVTSGKTQQEAALLEFSWPSELAYLENFFTVIQNQDYALVRAFVNSTILTVVAVGIMVVLAAMVGFVLQRRRTRWNPLIDFLVMAGLIVPPAVVPTIWVLQGINLFNTLAGLIFVHVAFGLSFCVLLFKSFMATIPREIDEAALIDGAGPVRLFFRLIFPLLKSVIVTVIVVQAVTVFNDFTYALYFFNGPDSETVQVTLYDYQSQGLNQWGLLFMDILLITIPPLVMFIFFNRQIVAGMTSGAVKG